MHVAGSEAAIGVAQCELAIPCQCSPEMDRRLTCGGMPKVVGNALIGRVSTWG